MQLQPEVLDSTPRGFTARDGEGGVAAATIVPLHGLKLRSAASEQTFKAPAAAQI